MQWAPEPGVEPGLPVPSVLLASPSRRWSVWMAHRDTYLNIRKSSPLRGLGIFFIPWFHQFFERLEELSEVEEAWLVFSVFDFHVSLLAQ